MINQIYKFIDCQISNTVIFMINIFLYSIFVIFFYRLTISYFDFPPFYHLEMKIINQHFADKKKEA